VDGKRVGRLKAPEALLLPDPGTRFFNTAIRLETLATGHPMEDWLRFMAKLCSRPAGGGYYTFASRRSSNNPSSSRRSMPACLRLLRMDIAEILHGAMDLPCSSIILTTPRRRRQVQAVVAQCARAMPSLIETWPTTFFTATSKLPTQVP